MHENIYKKGKNFNEWHYNYSNEKKINLITFFTERDLSVLEKLEILINNSLYTEKEFDLLYEFLFEYYKIDENDNIIQSKLLKKKKVSKNDYERILYIFNIISEKYDL